MFFAYVVVYDTFFCYCVAAKLFVALSSVCERNAVGTVLQKEGHSEVQENIDARRVIFFFVCVL